MTTEIPKDGKLLQTMITVVMCPHCEGHVHVRHQAILEPGPEGERFEFEESNHCSECGDPLIGTCDYCASGASDIPEKHSEPSHDRNPVSGKVCSPLGEDGARRINEVFGGMPNPPQPDWILMGPEMFKELTELASKGSVDLPDAEVNDVEDEQ